MIMPITSRNSTTTANLTSVCRQPNPQNNNNKMTCELHANRCLHPGVVPDLRGPFRPALTDASRRGWSGPRTTRSTYGNHFSHFSRNFSAYAPYAHAVWCALPSVPAYWVLLGVCV